MFEISENWQKMDLSLYWFWLDIKFIIYRKSTLGYYTFVLGNLVTSRSKKQEVVARSSAEVGYRTMSLGI